jgi:hypothetical protein
LTAHDHHNDHDPPPSQHRHIQCLNPNSSSFFRFTLILNQVVRR